MTPQNNRRLKFNLRENLLSNFFYLEKSREHQLSPEFEYYTLFNIFFI